MILYQGPSMIDGAPIVVIAPSGRSTNGKTGALLQTYILRADVSPADAIKQAADASICGACPHRGVVINGRNVGRTCYVNVGQGPRAVFDAYQRGRYAVAQDANAIAAHGAGRKVRLGTYGDPAAVPAHVWHALLARADGHTGYTHQWREPLAQALRGIVMASADSIADAREAHAAGWSTFRVRMPHESGQRMHGEAQCPAAKEVGAKVQCADCMACDGSSRSRAIDAHGGFAVMANVRRIAAINV